ncbi:MAG: TlyA family RNA methyltransferase, partial [Kiritimatiellae bacterium]|nr:TlyA family RNA methyltransferase [Kiritimatiellia bacterium]
MRTARKSEDREARTERLDILLTRQGLAASREQAQRLIGAGKVVVNGQIVSKPSRKYRNDAAIRVKPTTSFVSRGGEKLEAAIRHFGIDVANRVCLDVGASTGGFTQCLLRHGALRVYAVDVGRGQLHWRLRTDPRVVVMEGINARHLTPADLPEKVDLATIDVSFISLTKILLPVTHLMRTGGVIVTLIKPQFEAGRKEVCRGGVVRSEAVRQRVVEEIRTFGVEQVGLRWMGTIESPLRGPAGNIEYLACWETSAGDSTDE